MRASFANGLDVAFKNTEENLRVYPLSEAANPPKLELISGSGVEFNTIHANDFTFYEQLNEVIRKEPLEMLDPETRGLFAPIGMEKGKPFEPDQRMKRILTDAVAIGNAATRSIVRYPRTDGTMLSIEVYPGADSAWVMAWNSKYMLMLNPPHPGEIIKELCFEPLGLSVTAAAKGLGTSRKTLSSIINGRAGISPEMPIRLSIAFDTSAESWLIQQTRFDLWQAEQNRDSLHVHRLSAA